VHLFCREEQAEKKQYGEKPSRTIPSRVEKESHMPAYVASIGDGAYDGTFDDFLELALQFGVVTMFAGAFPLVGLFALINNLMEIRTDSFKLTCTMRRPTPHAVASIGAWLNIFQVRL
jgi:anoctamin-10